MVAVMALSMTVPLLYSIVLDTVPVLEPRIDKSGKHLLKQHGGMHHLHVLGSCQLDTAQTLEREEESVAVGGTG